MRKMYMFLAIAIAVAVVSGSALAATTIWLSDSGSGTAIPGDSKTVTSGADVTLYCFLASDVPGNVFDVMVGFDTSNAAGYGAGVIGDAATGKLTLQSTLAQIRDSIPVAYNQIRTAAAGIYADKSVVLNATGREDPANPGTKPFGFDVREGASGSAVPVGNVQVFSFTLKNNMPAGQSQTVVVHTTTPVANSFASAWKNGISLSPDSYVLTIVSGSALPSTVYGIPNKTVNAPMMTPAVKAAYGWVLWGKVAGNPGDDGNFTVDDGSGVVISVIGPVGNPAGIVDGDYVSVKGTLSGTTLTAVDVKKY